MSETMLTHALKYAARGWPVFPVHAPIIDGATVRCSCSKGAKCPPSRIGKHPRTRHGLNDATTDAAQIRRWWAEWPDANIGIITGPETFIVLDADPRHGGDVSLPELETKLGTLPDSVTALTGGGGDHRLFRHPGFRVACTSGELAPGIDVKGDGGYIVVEPSLHKSGRRYAWELSSAPDMVELAALPANWLRALGGGAGDGVSDSDSARADSSDSARADSSGSGFGDSEGKIACDSLYLCLSVTPGSPECPALTVEQVIERTLPAHPGRRNRAVFDLARGLRFNVGLRTVADCEPHVRRWHQLAEQRHLISGDDDVIVTLMDFEYAFDRAAVPLGADLAKLVMKVAKDQPTPKCAERYLPNENVVLLVKVCRELQRFTDPLPFSLSASQAAAILGKDGHGGRMFAHRCLWSLEKAGIIACAERGKKGWAGSPATRYRYIGDQPQHVINTARMQALTERFTSALMNKRKPEPSRQARLEQLRRLATDEKMSKR